MKKTVNSQQLTVNSNEQKTHHSSLITFHLREARGFTLLIAILVSSILLSLGFAIYNIVSKELILTASGRESQFAFYAADSGIECALYWDYQHNAFSTSTPAQPTCAGAPVSDYNVSFNSGTGEYTTTFNFSLGGTTVSPCTGVTLVRRINPVRTTLTAAGYNTCVLNNPRRIERAIRVVY
jgi:Tfp pilus assembly protein PilX